MTRGRPKSTVPTEPISTRLPSDIVAILRQEAGSREWSMSQLVAKILTQWAKGGVK